jgi:hypothetical protein
VILHIAQSLCRYLCDESFYECIQSRQLMVSARKSHSTSTAIAREALRELPCAVLYETTTQYMGQSMSRDLRPTYHSNCDIINH